MDNIIQFPKPESPTTSKLWQTLSDADPIDLQGALYAYSMFLSALLTNIPLETAEFMRKNIADCPLPHLLELADAANEEFYQKRKRTDPPEAP